MALVDTSAHVLDKFAALSPPQDAHGRAQRRRDLVRTGPVAQVVRAYA